MQNWESLKCFYTTLSFLELPSDKYGYKYEYKNISGKVLSAFAVFEYNVFVDADVAPR